MAARKSGRVLALVLGLLALALGFGVGALSLSGVEPVGLSFVDCGPAVFGRPDPLPHPTCASAYAPLPAVTWALIGLGALGVLYALLGNQLRRTGQSARSMPIPPR